MAAVPSEGHAAAVRSPIAPADELASRLYERYRRQIFNFCLHQLGNREEAEDATQSTFLNAFRGLKRGTTPEFETAWLYKIAHNVCLNGRQSSKKRRLFESAGDFDTVQETVSSPQGDTDELFNLTKALQVMPDQQRRALLLREWQGLAYSEISVQMNLSQSAVETLLFRARRTLAQSLETEPQVRKRGRPRSSEAGSWFAVLKSLFVGGATKLAATAVTVAATSVVATAPPVRHQIAQVIADATATSAPVVHQAAPKPKHKPKAAHVTIAGTSTAIPRVALAGDPKASAGVTHHTTVVPAVSATIPHDTVPASTPALHMTTRHAPPPAHHTRPAATAGSQAAGTTVSAAGSSPVPAGTSDAPPDPNEQNPTSDPGTSATDAPAAPVAPTTPAAAAPAAAAPAPTASTATAPSTTPTTTPATTAGLPAAQTTVKGTQTSAVATGGTSATATSTPTGKTTTTPSTTTTPVTTFPTPAPAPTTTTPTTTTTTPVTTPPATTTTAPPPATNVPVLPLPIQVGTGAQPLPTPAGTPTAAPPTTATAPTTNTTPAPSPTTTATTNTGNPYGYDNGRGNDNRDARRGFGIFGLAY